MSEQNQQQDGGQQNGGQQQSGNQQQQDNGAQGNQQAPVTFDQWMADQPEETRTLIDGHLDRLKTALDTERAQRQTLDRQLKALSKQAGNDTELKAQIDKLAAENQETGSKADFYEAAHTAGVRNLRLAWVAAKEMGLMGDGGKVDFGKLKEAAPELFAAAPAAPKVPNANAGTGAGQHGAVKPNMNNFLRTAAGH